MARIPEFDRTRVLDRAMNLFWTRGYAETSMQDLVDHLGLNRSSIYNTFGDKHALFIECLERYRVRVIKTSLEMVEAADDPAAAIESLFLGILNSDAHAKIPRGCFMVNTGVELGPHDDRIGVILSANARDTRETFVRVVSKGQSLGRISRKHDAGALAAFLDNGISGIYVAVKSGIPRKVLRKTVDVIMSVLEDAAPNHDA